MSAAQLRLSHVCSMPPGASMAQIESTASVRTNVLQALREAISSGALKPGDRLSDAKLCEDYGVSWTSIREALRYLESEKLITILRNRRACIARVTPRQATTIYELLAALLGDAAAMLAGSATTRTIRQLRAVESALETAWHDDAVMNTQKMIAALTARNQEGSRRAAQAYFQAEAGAVDECPC
jgi:DNA-binding GntR family transcriptional regulator